MNRRVALVALGLVLALRPAWGQAPAPTGGIGAHGAELVQLLDRPRVAPEPQSQGESRTADGLTAATLRFRSEAHPDGTFEQVPVLIVRPADRTPTRRPAVIALHGTGGTKEGMRPWLDDLAKRGFVAVALDGRYHGERNSGKPGTEAYNAAIVRAWQAKPGEPQAHPLYLDTVWDVWRTVDYLQSRPDVDPDRIGLMGISKGGIETWLAAAGDPRIKVVVPAIAVQSFRWSLDHDKWHARANTVKQAHEAVAKERNEPEVTRDTCLALWSKVLPGILDRFDPPSLLPEYAGRPLLILNGELDPNCPITGAEVAFEATRQAYHAAGADDRLKILVAPGVGHKLTPAQHDAALAWFTTWLKPTAP